MAAESSPGEGHGFTAWYFHKSHSNTPTPTPPNQNLEVTKALTGHLTSTDLDCDLFGACVDVQHTAVASTYNGPVLQNHNLQSEAHTPIDITAQK